MSTYHVARARTVAIAIAALVTMAGSIGPVASADAGRRVVTRSGACSTLGTWKLKAGVQNPGRIAAEFDVDTNRPGQRFTVGLHHNGRRVADVVRVTRAPSGSFTVRTVVANRAGADRFFARATRVGGGNTCAGRVRF